MEIPAYILNYIKNSGKGGTLPTGEIEITENGIYDVTNYAEANVNVASTPPVTITNCDELFYKGRRIDIIDDLILQCKPTSMKGMFFNISSTFTVPVMDLSGLTDINNVSNCFAQTSKITNDGLNNILASLLTITSNSFFPKELSRFGISSTLASVCTTLSNWQACVNAGWTTGY